MQLFKNTIEEQFEKILEKFLKKAFKIKGEKYDMGRYSKER